MFARLTRRSIAQRPFARTGNRTKATTANPAGDAEKNQGWRIWILEQKGMWPVIGVTVLTMIYGGYNLFFDFSGPHWKTDRNERRTIDYLENDKDPKKAIKWRNSIPQAGPDIVHKLNPYPTTSDYKAK